MGHAEKQHNARTREGGKAYHFVRKRRGIRTTQPADHFVRAWCGICNLFFVPLVLVLWLVLLAGILNRSVRAAKFDFVVFGRHIVLPALAQSGGVLRSSKHMLQPFSR